MVQKKVIQQRPSYAIESVDNALRLLQLLRDENAIRVRDAAAELGIAPSTAHRLLAMLVYRGFAVQDESRRYLPGLGIGAAPVSVSWTSALRAASAPHLEQLRDTIGETVHLVVRVGDKVRFLLTIESQASLRVGDLRGAVLPAHQTAAGMSLLAGLHDEQVALMYRSKTNRRASRLSYPELTALMQGISEARQNGYATNRGLAEEGVGSAGFALHLPSSTTRAAIAVASPVMRLSRLLSPASIAACRSTVAQINEEIRTLGIDAEGEAGMRSVGAARPE
ncbi:IclR family transcriptional regulator [Leucobacter sp. USHLN153]|uniref:IclR family transcriptional regulator n=1 Tax=Leucobacter sp. USHLN153 TaxID=3081268 RepID=UPI0030192195